MTAQVKFLALDLGTKTGWACTTDKGQTLSGVNDYTPKKHEPEGMRFLRFEQWLLGLGLDSQTIISFEDVKAHKGTIAAHIYGGLKSIVLKLAAQKQIKTMPVGVGTIKRHLTGSGKAEKRAMIDEVIKRGHSPKDDNEADAIAIMYWLKDTLGESCSDI